MTKSHRADVYALLAELLADPPDWISLPGKQWPLFETLKELTLNWEAAQLYLDRLYALDSESLVLRKERYFTLFAAGRPRYWLNESAALTGKILAKQTFDLARLYKTAGLEVNGAELPDHISLELTFLSYIVGVINDPSLERQFLEVHGSWMVNLGHALASCGDQVYALLGSLLADWLEASLKPSHFPELIGEQEKFPVISQPEDCILCGFCAQVCRPRALRVTEDHESTMLVLNASACIHCGLCERICESHVLKMQSISTFNNRNVVLRTSPLANCQICRQPIASQAEMQYIVSQVGEADWQHLCLDCRTKQTY